VQLGTGPHPEELAMTSQSGGQADKSLARVEIFRDLSDADRRKIEQRCRWRVYDPQQTLIARDQDSHDVHFIVWGQVRALDYAVSGREIAFDDVGAGGCVGELAAIDGLHRSATVIAVHRTLTGALDPHSFLRVLADYPDAGLAMMRRLSRMVRQASTRIMDLSALGANNRVHADLLRLARASAKPGANEARISPIPIHADIASRVSTTRETVARVMGDLTKDGLLRKERNALVVPDLAALEALVLSVRGGSGESR
jgi:CRP-like cAMP-binding protein